MIPGVPESGRDGLVVAEQVGRVPRPPWRVAVRCRFGYPTVIVSPSVLADGMRFPTFAWLTCPWLIELASAAESRGETALWARRAAVDAGLRSQLAETDRTMRELRAAESGGNDACAVVGIAGQASSAGVKCLHAHVALALVGVPDPIGLELLGEWQDECDDERCARLIPDASAQNSGAHVKEGA